MDEKVALWELPWSTAGLKTDLLRAIVISVHKNQAAFHSRRGNFIGAPDSIQTRQT
jgi:hypothetical protein